MLKARLQKSKVSELYRRIAPVYDWWAHLTEAHARNRCLELASIQDGEAILEVAVGTGLLFERILFLNPSGRNEGIDLTDAMLSRAARRAARSGTSNYRLRVGDAYALDYPDNDFELLINSYMFDLLPEQDFLTVLTEFRRVLRPGGRLVVTSMTNGEHWFNGMWEWIYRINPRWMGGCRGVSLLPDLNAAGFLNTKREYLSQLSFPSEVVFGTAP